MSNMLKQKENIISDLDGVIALDGPRRPLIESHGWKAYFKALGQDEMNQSVVRLLHFMNKVHTITIITSRPECYRNETERWLLDRYIPYDHLLMRPKEHTATGTQGWQHHMTDEELKQAHLAKQGLFPENTMCVLEDRQEMVDMYRRIGFDCWQVHPEGEMYVPK